MAFDTKNRNISARSVRQARQIVAFTRGTRMVERERISFEDSISISRGPSARGRARARETDNPGLKKSRFGLNRARGTRQEKKRSARSNWSSPVFARGQVGR